jgi:ParB family transcriptional regulator, chromosome partitioning protein
MSTRLGRGMDALLPTGFSSASLLPEERIKNVLIDNVLPNQKQPRKVFDEQQLQELADSIRSLGVLQPIIVVERPGGQYEIVAGERRFRASRLAGLSEIPVIVRSHEGLERLEIALTENVQRVDLNPLEQAMALAALRDQFSVDIKSLAKRLGKADKTIINMIRLLDLPEEAKSALMNNRLTEGHARTLLSLKDDPERQKQMLKAMLKERWTVRQAEAYVQKVQRKRKQVSLTSEERKLYTDYTGIIKSKLGLPVVFRPTNRGGNMIIKYKSLDELTSIINKLN